MLLFEGVPDTGAPGLNAADVDVAITNAGGSVTEAGGDVIIDIGATGTIEIEGAATGSISSVVDFENAGNTVVVNP